MEITLLASGSRPWQYWLGYWGLSFLVGEEVLFDTFINYRILLRKLKQVKADPSKIRSVVVSHQHKDHIGGLWKLLEAQQNLNVYLPSHVAEGTKERVRTSGHNLIDLQGIKKVAPGIYVASEVATELNGKTLYEQSLVLDTDKGLFVLVGCSHPGIVSMVKNIKTTFNRPVYGLAGGLHLMNQSSEKSLACAEALKEEGVQMIAPTHCTGWRGERAFKKAFNAGFVRMCEQGKIIL